VVPVDPATTRPLTSIRSGAPRRGSKNILPSAASSSTTTAISSGRYKPIVAAHARYSSRTAHEDARKATPTIAAAASTTCARPAPAPTRSSR
jgi:hypothetical protein